MKRFFQNSLKELKEDKKGEGDLKSGLGIAIAFFGGITTLVVMGFVLIILAGNLGDSAADALPISTNSTFNETIDYELNSTPATSTYALTGGTELLSRREIIDCAIQYITNSTEDELAVTTDYTEENCILTLATDSEFNDTFLNVTYDYTYRNPDASNQMNNVSSASANFFSNATTWFSLLSVMIIIAVVIIVLSVVRKARKQENL